MTYTTKMFEASMPIVQVIKAMNPEWNLAQIICGFGSTHICKGQLYYGLKFEHSSGIVEVNRYKADLTHMMSRIGNIAHICQHKEQPPTYPWARSTKLARVEGMTL